MSLAKVVRGFSRRTVREEKTGTLRKKASPASRRVHPACRVATAKAADYFRKRRAARNRSSTFQCREMVSEREDFLSSENAGTRLWKVERRRVKRVGDGAAPQRPRHRESTLAAHRDASAQCPVPPSWAESIRQETPALFPEAPVKKPRKICVNFMHAYGGGSRASRARRAAVLRCRAPERARCCCRRSRSRA